MIDLYRNPELVLLLLLGLALLAGIWGAVLRLLARATFAVFVVLLVAMSVVHLLKVL